MDIQNAATRMAPRAQLSAAALALAGIALTSAPAPAQASPTMTAVVTGVGDVAAAVRAAGGKVLAELPLIGGVTARIPVDARLAPTQFTVVPNRSLKVSGTTAAEGPASTARATLGLGAAAGEGAGVTVAVVDTGVADVPDLAGRLTHVDVTGDGPGDGYGHGTFVAGLVAGDGSSSDGRYAGAAPAAQVLDVRVAHDDGTSDLATVLAGLQVVADHPEVDVLNLSLSSDSPLPYQLDPLTIALESLWARGVTVVVPAGNEGVDGRRTVTSPGIDPVLLTVGGLDEAGTADRSDDVVADWSSQGPAPDGGQKPDLAAPGAHLVSTGAPGSAVWSENPGSHVGDSYFTGSGTSFATALTSGAAAALLAWRPALSPDQVKALVTGTAYKVRAPRVATGSGGLDLAAARTAEVPEHPANAEPFPGDPAVWWQLVQALLDEDEETAARQWALLSLEARQWAARQWAASSWAARQWAGSSWSASSWAARQWAARQWAASSWGARQWAARQWAARQWAGSSWSARQWSARQWADIDWTARQWADDDWSARQWSARQWSARQWSGSSWSSVAWS